MNTNIQNVRAYVQDAMALIQSGEIYAALGLLQSVSLELNKIEVTLSGQKALPIPDDERVGQ